MAMKGNRSGPAVVANTASTRPLGGLYGLAGSIGAMRGIRVGTDPTTWSSEGTYGRVMQVGIVKSTSEGNPAQPSLTLSVPGFWRFRWSVRTGIRYIQVSVKQASNYATQRPTIVVKAATGILASDSIGTAGSSTGWITMSTTFTALTDGALWVELWNNDYSASAVPCYFDHLVAT